MKTLYSSAFFTIILGFFVLFQSSGQSLTEAESSEPYLFSNIYQDADIRETSENIAIELFERFDCEECNGVAKESVPFLKENYSQAPQNSFKIYILADSEKETELEPARTLHCAQEQGKFWEIYQAFHQQQEPLNRAKTDEIAALVGINNETFYTCLDLEETKAAIISVQELAKKRKVTLLPTLFINDRRLVDYQPLENIQKVLRSFK